ncbi:unnamed protein product [Brassicogethes aeneus]|uniref:Lipase domain-containing protein n=1 Tax=Brassicogethes aeneus TaxID=1431903 RepID=A0A9P0FJ48_BRAAE|nr:unnamed protein product [Brassicogethes aeneus]
MMDLSSILNTVCSFLGSVPILCPPEAAVYYFLFTRLNPKYHQQLILNEDTILNGSNIDFKKPTKMYITGTFGTYTSQDSQATKNAYLVNQDCNMILVDASEILTGIDLRSGAYILAEPVALEVAEFIDYMVTKGLKLSDLELIGLSLGGQVIGLAAAAVKSGKVAYDPVGLVFNGYPPSMRLDETDAELVIVLHTNPQEWGYYGSCGHIDFWVNRNLIIQPGCGPVESVLRSVENLADLSKKAY